MSINSLRSLSHLQLVLEQLSRSEGRRCPIGQASNEVVELLSEHWAIFAPGCQSIIILSTPSSWTLTDVATCRLNINDVPTVLFGLLQGSLPRYSFLYPNVEREWRGSWGFQSRCGVSTQPVRAFPSFFFFGWFLASIRVTD